jgi:hypothetical protein
MSGIIDAVEPRLTGFVCARARAEVEQEVEPDDLHKALMSDHYYEVNLSVALVPSLSPARHIVIADARFVVGN